jgi:hypothetical protein
MPMKILIFKTLDGQPHHDIDILIKDEKPIDVHTEINWGGVKAISDKFIWDNVIYKKDTGIYIPNPDLDALIRMGHAVFEEGKFKQIDIDIINKSNGFKIYQEAKLQGWGSTFLSLLDYLRPGKLPIWLLAWGVYETKAWGKLWGARYILRDRIWGN